MPKKRTHAPIADPVADARNLRRHTTATAGELRAFLRELQGRSPREMLGEVASSNLGRSTITASIGAGGLIFALTLIPFAWSKLTTLDEPPPQRPSAPQPALTQAALPTQDPSPVGSAPSSDVAEKLGVGEQISSPATVNPLENTNGDLLKELE